MVLMGRKMHIKYYLVLIWELFMNSNNNNYTYLYLYNTYLFLKMLNVNLINSIK